MARLAKHAWLAGILAALLAFAQYAQCEERALELPDCQVHCVQQDQSAAPLDEANQPVPAALPFERAVHGPVSMDRTRAARPREDLPPGPSLRVLYCSYLN